MENLIKKLYKGSWIDRFEIHGTYASEVFSEKSDIIVLQIMVVDKFVIAELVRKQDFNDD